MNSFRKNILGVFLIVSLILLYFIVRFAELDNQNYKLNKNEKIWIKEQNGNPIPVLVPIQNSVHFYRDKQGNFQGTYVEYRNWLENEYGLKLEFIDIGNEAFTEEVDNGKAIMAYNASRSNQRMENYNFIDLRAKTSIILVKKNDSRTLEDKKSLKRIGAVQNSTEYKNYFDQYSSSEYEKIALTNYEEGLKKLENNEIDLLLGKTRNFLYVDNSLKIVEKKSDLNYYLIVNKNYPELSEIVEKTVRDFEEKQFIDMYFKHKTLYTTQMMEDKEILKKVKEKYKEIVVEFPGMMNRLPLYYIKDGKPEGYLPKLIQQTSKSVGLSIKFVYPGSSEKPNIEALSLNNSSDYSIPYYNSEIVVIGKKGSRYIKTIEDLRGFKIGVVQDRRITNYSPQNFKNYRVYQDIKSLLKGIEKGEIDYAVGDFIFLDSEIENLYKSKKLKILGVLTGHNYSISLGFKEEDKLLYELYSQILPMDVSESEFLKTILVSPKLINFNYYFVVSMFFIFIVTITIIFFFLKINIEHKKKAETLNSAIISSFEMASSYNDEDTGQHIVRVAKYSELIAKEIKMSKSFVKEIVRYASLHDIGKIGISDSILKKPGKLTPEEIIEMRKHSDIGFELVKNAKLGKIAENIVRFHHERYDGKGYPLGLIGDEIPIEAKIVSIADVYDALRQKRPYKNPFTHEEAVEIITSESGKIFDPKLVEIFIKINKNFDKIFTNC